MTRSLKLLLATLAATAVLAAASLGPAAQAADPAAAPDGAKLYMTKTCLACHGSDGKTPILPIYPKIAGQNEAYAVQQMKDIKSGARSNGQSAAMKGIMHLVTDEEIVALAKYVATLEP